MDSLCKGVKNLNCKQYLKVFFSPKIPLEKFTVSSHNKGKCVLFLIHNHKK